MELVPKVKTHCFSLQGTSRQFVVALTGKRIWLRDPSSLSYQQESRPHCLEGSAFRTGRARTVFAECWLLFDPYLHKLQCKPSSKDQGMI